MQGSTRCICKFSHHLKQPMICCDKCAKWQHASCMGITRVKFEEYNKCKDLQYHCEKCEPRYIDEERARAIQEALLKKEASSSSQESNKTTTSTDTGSTDDDEIVKKQDERKSSRDDRKNAQLEELFKKMENNPKQGRRRAAVQKKEKEEKEHNHDEDEEEPSDEEETTQKVPKKGRRGRPKGSGNKRRHLDVSIDHGDGSETQTVKRPRQHRKPREIRQTDSPGLASGEPSEPSTPVTSSSLGASTPSSTRSTRLKGGRPGRRGRPGVGRRPKAANSNVTDQTEPSAEQRQLDQEGSDTEDSADSGLVEECEVVNLTVPLKNPYSVRRRLDISKFENVKSFGQDVTITFHDWEWRGGNNSKVIKKKNSDTWTSSLTQGGHFKKQWLMKNTEETKEVPDVNEIIREELRKRNVDLTKIPELNENGDHHHHNHQLPSEPKDDNSDQSSQKSDTQPVWHVDPPTAQPQASPGPGGGGGGETRTGSVVSETSTDSEKKKTEEKTKKLSMAEYLARNRERKKREAEEKARLEAERQKQQESRLSNDAVTAVLSSAIGAATNGSKVCDINADDITWLSRLVGINLNNGTQNALAELPIETTAERLSRLYHTSEQVLNTMRAANVLAALTAQQNK